MIQPPDYWLPTIPPYESQYSILTATDSMSCLCESLCHIIYMLTGFRASPRALAYFSATTINGNSIANVLDSINKVGVIPYNLWPNPDTFTWSEFYTPVPKAVWQQAIAINVSMIAPDIHKSPLWTILNFTKSDHAVAQLTIGKAHDLYFDSEPGDAVKTIYQPIVSQHSIIINHFAMFNIQFVHKAGTQEYGLLVTSPVGTLYVPASTEADLKARGGSFLPLNPDGSVNYAAAKEVSGL